MEAQYLDAILALCRGGGGVGTRPQYLIVCLWRRLLASRHWGEDNVLQHRMSLSCGWTFSGASGPLLPEGGPQDVNGAPG